MDESREDSSIGAATETPSQPAVDELTQSPRRAAMKHPARQGRYVNAGTARPDRRQPARSVPLWSSPAPHLHEPRSARETLRAAEWSLRRVDHCRPTCTVPAVT